MLVSLDFEAPVEVLNSVKVIIGDGDELHITVSADGVIYDRIRDGEVVRTQCVFADDILPDTLSAPVAEYECPNCKNGTVGLEEGRLVCRGECGVDFGPQPRVNETSSAGDAEDIDAAVLAIVENAPDWSDEKVLAVKKFADAVGKRSNA